VSGDAAGAQMISRSASAELMLDTSGHPVVDQSVSMRLSDMKTHVTVALAKVGSAR
jgi:hypothetical protein